MKENKAVGQQTKHKLCRIRYYMNNQKSELTKLQVHDRQTLKHKMDCLMHIDDLDEISCHTRLCIGSMPLWYMECGIMNASITTITHCVGRMNETTVSSIIRVSLIHVAAPVD